MDGTIKKMVLQMASKKRTRRLGRPPKRTLERLSERTMVRLDPVLRAAVEVRRQQMETEAGLEPGTLDLGTALRSMLRECAVTRGLLDPATTE